jgi:predicted nucleic acid-binding protein
MSESSTVTKLVVVANTGPMISAFQCDRIDLLEQLFDAIYIPSAALPEYEKHGVGDDIQALLEKGLVQVQTLGRSKVKQAAIIARLIADSPLSNDPNPDSHRADAEAIVLMQHKALGAHFILLDELAARDVAKTIGLSVTGFIGVLTLAYEGGLITVDEVEQALRTCQAQGTHYSNQLIDTTIRALRGEQ